jgi:hypothetical protein
MLMPELKNDTENDTDTGPDPGWRVSIGLVIGELTTEVMANVGNAIRALQADRLIEVSCLFEPIVHGR